MSSFLWARAGDRNSVAADAAAWHARLAADDVSERTRADFETWRTAAPEHALAYHELEQAHCLAREVSDTPAMLALRHETLARLVVPRRRIGAAALVTLSIAALLTVGLLASRNLTPDYAATPQTKFEERQYQTAIGERLTIELADGSIVLLNTASRLRVAYSDQERRLTLDAGEALFEVAKDQARPFVVSAADRDIVAHGTEFAIRLDEAQLHVALLEGTVSVRRNDAPDASEVRLRPNEALTATGETTLVRPVARIEQLVGWREGLVFFENTTLAQAAAEMNRYAERPQIVVAPTAADLRLSGAFHTGATLEFVEALRQGFPLNIVRRSEDQIVLDRRSNAPP